MSIQHDSARLRLEAMEHAFGRLAEVPLPPTGIDLVAPFLVALAVAALGASIIVAAVRRDRR